MPNEWIGVRELADELNVPERTVYAWRTRGKGPPSVKIGKYVRYRRADVDAWLADQYQQGNGAEHGRNQDQ